MMKRLQLKLIGNPRLFLDETEVEIRTRTVLELLAVILASGPGGISRGAVADRLWGHLPTSNAKNQMRIAIHRLREESKRMGIDQLLELDSGLLKSDPFSEIDPAVKELMRLSVEQMKSKNPEVTVGICGEHASQKSGVFICHQLGFDTVSCAAFRVPIVKLLAAQAAILSPRE